VDAGTQDAVGILNPRLARRHGELGVHIVFVLAGRESEDLGIVHVVFEYRCTGQVDKIVASCVRHGDADNRDVRRRSTFAEGSERASRSTGGPLCRRPRSRRALEGRCKSDRARGGRSGVLTGFQR
jgi:hypothetical protein